MKKTILVMLITLVIFVVFGTTALASTVYYNMTIPYGAGYNYTPNAQKTISGDANNDCYIIYPMQEYTTTCRVYKYNSTTLIGYYIGFLGGDNIMVSYYPGQDIVGNRYRLRIRSNVAEPEDLVAVGYFTP